MKRDRNNTPLNRPPATTRNTSPPTLATDAINLLVTLVSVGAEVDTSTISAALATIAPDARLRLIAAVPRSLPPATKTALVVALQCGTLPTTLASTDTAWLAEAISEGCAPVAALHQARHQARRFVDSVARMRLDPSLQEVANGNGLLRLSAGLNDVLFLALGRIPAGILDVLLGATPPTDPAHIYGVQAAAVSLLTPVLANDLAAFVHSKVQLAAAADILWGGETAEATWAKLLQ